MDLTNCLFQWLRTFDLKGNCSIPADLCDGVAITYALVQIAPENFSPSLLSKIEAECGSSWFLRVSNLRRIYLCIVDFYSEVLDRSIPDKLQPDLEAIAREYDLKHLGHLLQLILGCAINCSAKEQHIEVMTKLSLEVKHGLKVAIDELENFDETQHTIEQSSTSAPTQSQPSGAESQEQYNKLQEELSSIKLSKEKALQKCIELEGVVGKLKDEKQVLKIEIEKLNDKLSRMPSSVVSESTLRFDSIEHETLFQRLNNQINSLQCELSQMEEQKEDYRIHLEMKEKEHHKTLLQIEQLQSKLNEFKHDRDELDQLKYLNEEIIKYKNINEVQKKKLEEFQELKKQIRMLEDRNASLIKQTCELEDDKKSMAVFKGQLELIKKQRDELRQEASQEAFRADKAEAELKRINQKYSDVEREKEKLHVEVDKLRLEMANLNRNEPLGPAASIDILDPSQSMVSGNSVATHALGSSLSPFKNDFAENAEINEKLIRLEFENDKLKKELQQSNDGKVKLLESQLDDEKTRLGNLEAENRSHSQRIIELEGQLQEYKSMGSAGARTNNDSEVNELRTKLKELEQEKHSLISLVDKKNNELTEREDRFKKHVTKAKETIELLETHVHNNTKSLPDTSKVQSDDISYWRNLASQRDAELDSLRGEFEKSNAFRDMEERLISAGFHNLSFHLQRKAAEDRIYNFSPNPTFLSRQRQASSRKFIIPPSSDLVE